MKFLVIVTLCVYAASAAPPVQYSPWQQPAKVVTVASVQPAAKSVYKAEAKSTVFQGYKPQTKAGVKSVEVVNPYQSAVSTSVGVNSNFGGKSVASASSSAGYNNAYESGKDEILRYDSEVNPDGFHYVYNTANGITAESSGTLKTVDDAAVLVVQGFYEYAGPEGTPIRVEYIADENGFQPKSDLLPVAPPVPEAILRSIKYIAEHPAYVAEAGKKF